MRLLPARARRGHAGRLGHDRMAAAHRGPRAPHRGLRPGLPRGDRPPGLTPPARHRGAGAVRQRPHAGGARWARSRSWARATPWCSPPTCPTGTRPSRPARPWTGSCTWTPRREAGRRTGGRRRDRLRSRRLRRRVRRGAGGAARRGSVPGRGRLGPDGAVGADGRAHDRAGGAHPAADGHRLVDPGRGAAGHRRGARRRVRDRGGRLPALRRAADPGRALAVAGADRDPDPPDAGRRHAGRGPPAAVPEAVHGGRERAGAGPPGDRGVGRPAAVRAALGGTRGAGGGHRRRGDLRAAGPGPRVRSGAPPRPGRPGLQDRADAGAGRAPVHRHDGLAEPDRDGGADQLRLQAALAHGGDLHGRRHPGRPRRSAATR